MDIFMLLDRTGSMQRRWDEAVNALNVYVDEVVKAAGSDLLTEQDRVTLACFDRWQTGTTFDVLRDAVPLTGWKPLRTDEVTPRGDTPLLDAVVRLAAVAEAKGSEKTVVVIMTDGEENASSEVTKDGARAAIERLQKRGWQVVYLGADFDAFDQAGRVGVGAAATLSAASGHIVDAMRATARETRTYRITGAPMAFRDADRKQSGESKVTKRKPS
jgi:uncharacterized protein YegL